MIDRVLQPAGPGAHPAVAAWRALEPDRLEPEQITALQDDDRSTKKVYRLSRTGRSGYAVIAKKCRQDIAATERIIYTEVLPRLPVPTLRFFGCVDDAEENFSWLLVEDAGEFEYSRETEQHRLLAGQWLALLHGCSARLDLADRLPNWRAEHYLQEVRVCRDAILQNINQPVLTGDDRSMLKQLLSHFDSIEARWHTITRFCDDMPRTVMHADFAPKNMRVRPLDAGPTLFPYDFECAVWGVPVTDLTQHGHHSPYPDLGAYCGIARQFWPQLSMQHVEMLALVGWIFRRISSTRWACDSLDDALSRQWLKVPLSQLQSYESSLRDAVQQLDCRFAPLPPSLARFPGDRTLADGRSVVRVV